jgi:hypothetical protein
MIRLMNYKNVQSIKKGSLGKIGVLMDQIILDLGITQFTLNILVLRSAIVNMVITNNMNVYSGCLLNCSKK